MLNSSSNTFQAVYHEIIIIFLYFGKFGYKQKEKRKLVITMAIILSCKGIRYIFKHYPRAVLLIRYKTKIYGDIYYDEKLV